MRNANIKNAIEEIKVMNKNWFYRFFEMLEKIGVSEETVDTAFNLILREDNAFRGSIGINSIFIKNKESESEIDLFYSYCYQLVDEKGENEFKNFLEQIIINIKNRFDFLKIETSNKKTNVYYLFLRELVLANPEKIKVVSNGTLKNGRMYLDFAGISIGHITYEISPTNEKLVVFDDFRTIPGLENIGLGSYLFSEFCKKVVDMGDDYSVAAWGVMKGRDGEVAYSSWGGYPILPQYSEEGAMIIGQKLTKEEYDSAPKSINYYFPSSVVLQNSKKRSKKYGILDDECDIELNNNITTT